MSADIFGVHGKRYTSQKSIQLYMTTGTASDWFYSDDANRENKHRAAGYTFELRDTGLYGFELPADQVQLELPNLGSNNYYLIIMHCYCNGTK